MIPPLFKEANIYEPMGLIISFCIIDYMDRRGVTYREALDVLGIKSTWPEEAQRNYTRSVIKSSVMTSIEKDRAFIYRDSRKSYIYNRDEIMFLCGELALRSIIGVKRYAKCYRGLVLSRMAGFASIMSESALPDEVRQFVGAGGKRQWRKLIKSLQNSGYSIYCPTGTRGFYASYRMTLDELAVAVEKKGKSKKTVTVRELSDEARNRALEKMGRTP